MGDLSDHLMTIGAVFGVGGTVLLEKEHWGIPFLVIGVAILFLSLYALEREKE